jgi:sterol-4alpha-carboxylate 3-dehydrogenase (decarboxylating)
MLQALAEQLVLSYSCLTLPTAATRAHAVFGPDDRNIIPLLLAAPHNIRLGPGTNLYDFTYAQNNALANCLAATNLLNQSLAPEKSAAGKAFFITNAEPVPFRDFLSWIYESYEEAGEPTISTSIQHSNQEKQAKVTEIPMSVAKVLVWVLETVAKLTRTKATITYSELGDSTATRWFDNSQARNILGYVPEVNLREGIRITMQGLKNAGT